jgi:raffinose/stachyose/melibiose transport system permease protein
MMLFVGFYKSIPKELDECATIDGCNPFQIYWKVILPLSKSVMATVTILSGLQVWREFFIPLVIITTPMKKTLSVGLLHFMSRFSFDWTPMCAAMIIQTLPIIVLFLLLQKYFIGGMVSGAVKA